MIEDIDYLEVSHEEAHKLVGEIENLLILDNRDLESYKQGHIDGAMMAHEGLIESIINKGDKKVPVLVYCYQGSSSKDVAKTLCACGFDTVYTMVGGYAAWKRQYGA